MLLLNIFYLTHFVSATEIKLIANDGNNDDKFGYSIDVDKNYAIVGAPYNDEKGSDAGCAYVFKKKIKSGFFIKNLQPVILQQMIILVIVYLFLILMLLLVLIVMEIKVLYICTNLMGSGVKKK